MATEKRPESFEDLASYRRIDSIVDLNLTPELLGTTVVHTVNTLIVQLRQVYGEDLIVARVQNDALLVERNRTEAEMAAALAQEQLWWDQRHPDDAPKAGA